MTGLDRFVTAQAPVIADVMAELCAGRKETHWMWFVFPQLASLGRSGRARFYGIAGLDEAVAYLGHPLLRARLIDCADAVTALTELTPEAVFGPVDARKLRSSATLFAIAADVAGDAVLAARMRALLAWAAGGAPCPLTLAELLAAAAPDQRAAIRASIMPANHELPEGITSSSKS